MLDHLNEHNCCHRKPFSRKNIQEAVIRVLGEEEEDAKSNVNKVTMDNSFQSIVAIIEQTKRYKRVI